MAREDIYLEIVPEKVKQIILRRVSLDICHGLVVEGP